jgi:hypothetical protein
MKNKYNDKKDMTKKAWLEQQKKKRVTTTMNTGTRDMQTDKHPTRAKQKEIDRREMI